MNLFKKCYLKFRWPDSYSMKKAFEISSLQNEDYSKKNQIINFNCVTGNQWTN